MTRNPNTHPKSELTLSAGPELGTYGACRPDEFPPYEPVPAPKVRLIADVKVITNPLDFASTFAIWFSASMFVAYALGWLR